MEQKQQQTETKNRYVVIFDKTDEKYPYAFMETAWTDDELKFRWDVLSEHSTKEEARIEFESKYGSKVNQ
jgi:hypothetical protein